MTGDSIASTSQRRQIQPLAIGTVIMEYEIRKVIGRGGFGIVYLVEHPVLRQKLALKEFCPARLASRSEDGVLQPYEGDEALFEQIAARFDETATQLCSLSHPNIVRVLNHTRANNTSYILMDYITGEELSAYLEKRIQDFDEARLRKLLGPLLDAVGYLHSHGLMHRDIAPDNVLIRDDGSPVLIDFGTLKAHVLEAETRLEDDPQTAVIGKPFFSPPEQLSADRKSELTFSADVYAMAATIYDGLAGRGEDNRRILEPVQARLTRQAQAPGDPTMPPLEEVTRIEVSNAFSRTVDKGLSLNPYERPQSISDFKARLFAAPVVAEVPPEAPPEPKKTRRLVPMVLGAAVLAAVAFGALRPDLIQSGTAVVSGLFPGGTATVPEGDPGPVASVSIDPDTDTDTDTPAEPAPDTQLASVELPPSLPGSFTPDTSEDEAPQVEEVERPDQDARSMPTLIEPNGSEPTVINVDDTPPVNEEPAEAPPTNEEPTQLPPIEPNPVELPPAVVDPPQTDPDPVDPTPEEPSTVDTTPVTPPPVDTNPVQLPPPNQTPPGVTVDNTVQGFALNITEVAGTAILSGVVPPDLAERLQTIYSDGADFTGLVSSEASAPPQNIDFSAVVAALSSWQDFRLQYDSNRQDLFGTDFTVDSWIEIRRLLHPFVRLNLSFRDQSLSPVELQRVLDELSPCGHMLAADPEAGNGALVLAGQVSNISESFALNRELSLLLSRQIDTSAIAVTGTSPCQANQIFEVIASRANAYAPLGSIIVADGNRRIQVPERFPLNRNMLLGIERAALPAQGFLWAGLMLEVDGQWYLVPTSQDASGWTDIASAPAGDIHLTLGGERVDAASLLQVFFTEGDNLAWFVALTSDRRVSGLPDATAEFMPPDVYLGKLLSELDAAGANIGTVFSTPVIPQQ